MTSAEITAFIDKLPKDAISDLPIKVVDVGGYRVGVYGVFRPKAVKQDAVLHEVRTTEVYQMVEGAGTLVTGGTLVDVQRDPKSTTVRGSRIEGGVSRRVVKGDVIIIPGRTPHMWRKLESDIKSTIIRSDPGKPAAAASGGFTMRALLLPMILAAGRAAAEPARPVKLEKAAADAVMKEIQKDRTDTDEWLKQGITSYLATVDRQDFGTKKMLTVGRTADDDLRIDNDEVMPHHLKVTIEGDKFHVQAVEAGAQFKVGTEEKREAIVGPSSVGVGRFQLRLSHQSYPGIIVFDRRSRGSRPTRG